MPKINPYESPQSEIRPTLAKKPRSSAMDTVLLNWLVPNLVGLQILAALLIVTFVLFRVPLRELTVLENGLQISALSCLGLGVLLLLIAAVQKYTKLLIFELIVLAVFFSLQMMHIARH